MTLDVYREDRLSRARLWMDPDTRRREAMRAARDHHLDDLWSLTEAHHTLHGGGTGSRHTLRTYRNGVRLWLQYAGRQAISVLHPSADHGTLFTRELEAGTLRLERRTSKGTPASTGGAPLAHASVVAYLAGARTLYRALRWAGATTADPFLDVKPAPDRTAKWDKRQPYPQDAVEALLAVGDARHHALVLLGAHAGLRATEIVRLRWQDINLVSGTAHVTGKGGKVRRVNLSRSLKEALEALRASAVGEWVIGGSPEAARLRLRRACLEAGVPYLALHPLRHTAGTRLVRAGRTLQDVARHLGHASVATAEIYGKWADEALKRELDEW